MNRPKYKQLYLEERLKYNKILHFYKGFKNLINELLDNLEIRESIVKSDRFFSKLYQIEVYNKDTNKSIYGQMIDEDGFIEEMLEGDEDV